MEVCAITVAKPALAAPAFELAAAAADASPPAPAPPGSADAPPLSADLAAEPDTEEMAATAGSNGPTPVACPAALTPPDVDAEGTAATGGAVSSDPSAACRVETPAVELITDCPVNNAKDVVDAVAAVTL